MDTRRKSVLLFQPSRFQIAIWRAILSEQHISVTWHSEYTDEKQIINYCQTPQSRPGVILIDLQLDNAYELCYWCAKHCPRSKIILTVDATKGYSPVIRLWADTQGVEKLLINFQQQDLLSNVVTNLNSVLKVLDCQPANKTNVIKALRSLDPQIIASSQSIVLVKNSLPLAKGQEEKPTIVLPTFISYSLIVLTVSLLVAIIALISTILWFVSPNEEVRQASSVQEQQLESDIDNNPTSFQDVDNVPSGVFNYGGSTTWAPIRQKVDPAIKTAWSEYQLRYTNPVVGNPGSGTGINMLLEDQLSFAQSSRPLTEKEFEEAKTRGFSLKQIPVAIDGIAIAVNPNLQIAGLTVAQLQDIYTGKLTNWQQVGGSDLPIVPYSRNVEEGGTVAFFVNNVLEGKNFGDNVQLVKDTTEGIRKVISNPGGIYYATMSEVVYQCKIKSLPIGKKQEELIFPYQKPYVPPSQCPAKRNQININALQSGEYPITRRLFVIVKQNGQQDENAGLAYGELLLSEQGQELIGQAGFIPLTLPLQRRGILLD